MSLTHKGTAVIQTERLVLRRFTREDANDMFNNWANDERVTKYLRWMPHQAVDITKDIIDGWVCGYQRDNCYNWAIEYDNKVIGNISVIKSSDRDENAELGYVIGCNWWNKGIVTEAVKAIIAFLFNEVGFVRISACHDTRNPASGKVMKKSGMLYEGTLIKACKNNKNNVFCDLACYAIIRDNVE